MIKYDLSGASEAYAALREMALMPSQRKEVRDGLQRGGEIIADLARQNIRDRTGNLSESIEVRNAKMTMQGVSVKVATTPPKGAHGLLVGRGHRARGGKGFVRAHPYLEPALKDGKGPALREISLGISRAMERANK